MDTLPKHGRIDCNRCFKDSAPVEFDQHKTGDSGWRITANPLAWGNAEPQVVVLGFSKGPTQAGALANTPHNEIAYKGSRKNVAKILSHVGVLNIPASADPVTAVDRAIADTGGRFHFGSLIRCTVERYDDKSGTWKGSGGGMLDKFVATCFGRTVASNCVREHLANLPGKTRLVVMFGLGTKLNYVRESFKLYSEVRPGNWRWINDVAYTDGNVVVVHVEHFASQGALIPNWLGSTGHERARLGQQARDAVEAAQVP
ncbi:MAG: hypothetical protein ABW101_18745 [Candidatus Thiodiazotropha sp.]